MAHSLTTGERVLHQGSGGNSRFTVTTHRLIASNSERNNAITHLPLERIESYQVTSTSSPLWPVAAAIFVLGGLVLVAFAGPAGIIVPWIVAAVCIGIWLSTRKDTAIFQSAGASIQVFSKGGQSARVINQMVNAVETARQSRLRELYHLPPPQQP